MRKILFLMRDKFYQEVLSEKLSSRFELTCRIIEDINEIEDELVITDYILDEKIWKLDFSSQDIKYQNINSIYEMIEKAFIERAEENRKAKIISVYSLSDSHPENTFVTELARQFSKENKTLLVNLNYFYSYKDELSDIGLDSLLFVDETSKSVRTNKLFNMEYLSSSKLPFEMEKESNYSKVIKILKNLKYDYIFIDISHQISSKIIEFLKNTDLIVYYQNSDINQKYKHSLINFIDNNSLSSEKIYIESNEKGHKVLKNNDEIQIKNIKDLVKILW